MWRALWFFFCSFIPIGRSNGMIMAIAYSEIGVYEFCHSICRRPTHTLTHTFRSHTHTRSKNRNSLHTRSLVVVVQFVRLFYFHVQNGHMTHHVGDFSIKMFCQIRMNDLCAFFSTNRQETQQRKSNNKKNVVDWAVQKSKHSGGGGGGDESRKKNRRE